MIAFWLLPFLCMWASHVQNVQLLITICELINNLLDSAGLTSKGMWGLSEMLKVNPSGGSDNAKEFIPHNDFDSL